MERPWNFSQYVSFKKKLIDGVIFSFWLNHQKWILVYKFNMSHVTFSMTYLLSIFHKGYSWYRFQSHTISRSRDTSTGVYNFFPVRIIWTKLYIGITWNLLRSCMFSYAAVLPSTLLNAGFCTSCFVYSIFLIRFETLIWISREYPQVTSSNTNLLTFRIFCVIFADNLKYFYQTKTEICSLFFGMSPPNCNVCLHSFHS